MMNLISEQLHLFRRKRQARHASDGESIDSIPTVEEARQRLVGFEGVFAGMSEEQRRELMRSGKDYPLGL